MYSELKTTDVILFLHFADDANMGGEVTWMGDRGHIKNNQGFLI